jgi:hypothetical protein
VQICLIGNDQTSLSDLKPLNGWKALDSLLFRQPIVPPMFLRVGFTIVAILMLDFQTGHEEEIGEFFSAFAFFL